MQMRLWVNRETSTASDDDEEIIATKKGVWRKQREIVIDVHVSGKLSGALQCTVMMMDTLVPAASEAHATSSI